MIAYVARAGVRAASGPEFAYVPRLFALARRALQDDIAAMLNDFSDGLGGRSIGVVDATPDHHRTLYFFLVSCRGYYAAPHIRFDPDEAAVETLYELYQRVTDQDLYVKQSSSMLD